MKKVAVVFVLAVFVPSLVLAWLAVRSLRDQQFLLERQQSLLYQGVVDGLAKDVQSVIADQQHAFSTRLETLLHDHSASDLSTSFDELVRHGWPLARIGFVVTSTGEILCPAPSSRQEAQTFFANNGRFLANRENAEVYLNPKLSLNNLAYTQTPTLLNTTSNALADMGKRLPSNRGQQIRNVYPQQQVDNAQRFGQPEDNQQQVSKVAPSAAAFRQLIGEETEGAIARFVDNKLNLLFWCRPALSTATPNTKPSKAAQSTPVVADRPLVFGVEVSLPLLVGQLQDLLQQVPSSLRQEICLALLDDMAKPAALSHPAFHANWKRPFVAAEISEALPHWEIALYLLDPAKLSESAQTLKLTLGLLIATLVLAIATGSWLIVRDLERQLRLARQKTDFVSNVSHELKTPLTSIRMFAELLLENRVKDSAKQHSYLEIITAEAARLTRLINNVLDFARIERGEKRYDFKPCDLTAIVHETVDTYRPHLEAQGFSFACDLPDEPLAVNGDRDALAQIVVNLLSNAEKYSGQARELSLEVHQKANPLPHVEVLVLDRGLGVPKGSEQRIFEKFYRAHDSLNSGIQGSGLGLTLARQIARAHGGEVSYAPRDRGGSCFSLRLPMLPAPDAGHSSSLKS